MSAAAAWPFHPTDRPSKVVCVGRNYAEHAAELGNPVPAAPLLFLKPPSALIPDGAPVVIPPGIGSVHHELELGVVLGTRLSHATPAQAAAAIRGWCLALDMTARDLQAAAKQKGEPWTVAKGYDTFCPVSAPRAKDAVDPLRARLMLKVDGVVRQDGTTRDMLWKVPELLAAISQVMTLEPGDLVLTGTPKGVGPVEPGQRMEGFLDGKLLLSTPVVAGA